MERPDTRRLAPSLTVLALTFGAAVPLTRLFSTDGVLPVVLLAALGAAGIGAAARRASLGPVLSWLAQAVGLLLFLSWRFASDTLAVFLPTARTFGGLADRLEIGARIINAESAPVVAHDEVLLFIGIGVWVTAWLIDISIAVVANPLLAIASAVPLFAVPGTLVMSQRRVLETLAFVVPAALVLWAHEQRRTPAWRVRPAAMLLVATVLPALLITPALPGFGASPILPGTGMRGELFNPFVTIKPTLDRSRETLLFTVETSRPGYRRLTALDAFDGRVWAQSPNQGRIANVGTDLPPSQHDGDVLRVEETASIASLIGPWAPVAYDPVRVEVRDELGGSVIPHLDDVPRAVIVERGIARGMRISSTSLVPVPRPRDLDEAPAAGPSMARYLDLPRGLPAQVREIAKQIAGDEPTPFRKAVALQAHLRTFTYDENVAAGHSFSTLVEFLTTVKRGYCEQFAASMAVLARAVGVPSRVVIGFTAGRLIGETGNVGTYAVTSRNAHAWTEIFFPGHGWIAFEPTPRAGFADPPGYTSPEAADLVAPSATPTASAAPSSSASASASPTASASAGAGPQGGGGFPAWPVIAVALAAGALLLVLLRPRLRRRRIQTALDAYAELLAWCDAAGLGRRPSETPREHLARVAHLLDPSVAALADPIDQVLWAGGPGEGLGERLSGTRRALAARLGRRRRLVAGVRWRLGGVRSSGASG